MRSRPSSGCTKSGTDELSPSVSWNGQKLAYISHEANAWALRMSDGAKGVDPLNYFFEPGQTHLRARLSGDGGRVLYANANYDLLSISSGGGVAEKLCERCGTVMGASSDGGEVLYEPTQKEEVMAYDAARHTSFAHRAAQESDGCEFRRAILARRSLGRVSRAEQSSRHRADLDRALRTCRTGTRGAVDRGH